MPLQRNNANNTNGINDVINYCVGKMIASKARVAGGSCSHFNTHNTASKYFNQQE